MPFIAGQYTATLGAATVGQIQAGITIEHTVEKQEIIGDNFAKTVQDAVFQGYNMFTAYTLMEYDALAAAASFWPYGSAYLNMSVVIGTLDSSNASQLILTVLAGTPAVGKPTSLTFPLAIIASGFTVGLLFAPELRTVPIRQRIYPTSLGVFGTTT